MKSRKKKGINPTIFQESGARQISNRKISKHATEVAEEGTTDHLPPVFSFASTCPNHFLLQAWQGSELKNLIDTLRIYSKLSWAEVKKQKGFKAVDPRTFSQPLPEHISPELTILECRVSGRARLFGFRTRNVFHVIWFDRNHDVYPMS